MSKVIGWCIVVLATTDIVLVWPEQCRRQSRKAIAPRLRAFMVGRSLGRKDACDSRYPDTSPYL